MKDEEKKYKNVISSLKSLPKVKAKDNFEQKLYRKLRDVDSERMSPSVQKLTKPAEKNWIFNIFKPAFIPAVGITLALIAVVVIYLNLKPNEDTIVKTENSQTEQKQEIVTKDRGNDESKEPSVNDKENLITQDLQKTETTGTLHEQEPPKSDMETISPSITKPEKEVEEEVNGKGIQEPTIRDQKIERKESKGKDVEEKEMKIEKKTGNIKKNENEDFPKMKNADEKTEQQNIIDDGVMQRALQPTLGLEGNKLKDTTKVDSMKSKNKKGKENSQDTNKVIQKETDKQAEPIRQEPEGNKQENKEQENKQDNK